MTIAMTAAISVSWTVTTKRRNSSPSTGRFVTKDVPRSPVQRLAEPEEILLEEGAVEAEVAPDGVEHLRRDALRARRCDGEIAGQRAHQHEGDERHAQRGSPASRRDG